MLTNALELDPNYFPALYALGALRFCCQSRIADGIGLAEQALRLDPTSTAVRSLFIHMYIPMRGDMNLVVGLGDLMMRVGDERRARRLLEMALSAIDLAAVKYQRGTMWFTLQRARALVLLGRDEEALGELGAFSRSGWAPDAWLLDADTAFDRLRGDERFKRIIAERHANSVRERAEVDALRSRKVIPEDLRWR